MSRRRRRPGESAQRRIFERIAAIREHREPFGGLAQRLVADVLEAVAPSGDMVEVGAGDGQLAAWLGPDARARTLYTEPTPQGVERLQAQGLQARAATAEALPCEDGSMAAVLGLCVLDIVDNPTGVVRELRRVLRPGGVVVHWLDMTTELAPALGQLHRSGALAVPNTFDDPSERTWPEDLMVIPRAQLDLIVEVLGAAGHPAAGALRRYRTRFSAPFSATRAADAFNALNDDPQAHRMLRAAFSDAMRLAPASARAQLSQFEGRPVSSAKFFASRLQQWFTEGFVVEHNAPICVAQLQAAEASQPRYRSLLAGSARTSSEVPPKTLTSDPPRPAAEQCLVELGMHTFVARKVP